MTYVDSSVVLARVLAEDRQPPAALWAEQLVASRLLEYEVWVRLNSHGFRETHGFTAQRLLRGIGLVELSPTVVRRALDPFPAPLRTLDALHLASAVHLRESGRSVQLASYDRRMVAVADVMQIPLYDLGA